MRVLLLAAVCGAAPARPRRGDYYVERPTRLRVEPRSGSAFDGTARAGGRLAIEEWKEGEGEGAIGGEDFALVRAAGGARGWVQPEYLLKHVDEKVTAGRGWVVSETRPPLRSLRKYPIPADEPHRRVYPRRHLAAPITPSGVTMHLVEAHITHQNMREALQREKMREALRREKMREALRRERLEALRKEKMLRVLEDAETLAKKPLIKCLALGFYGFTLLGFLCCARCMCGLWLRVIACCGLSVAKRDFSKDKPAPEVPAVVCHVATSPSHQGPSPRRTAGSMDGLEWI